jgi:REP element-mobilizing transposase RayT
MPRQARIDAPGALHHIIARSVDGCLLYKDNSDRDNFVKRLADLVIETNTRCLAWALIPNHFHLLLQTGDTPMATFMRRLLTGYAVSFNRRHSRSGHVFQNRYKSILCQEEPYLLELIRYIHLNPLRAGLVTDSKALSEFAYCGHGVLIGTHDNKWQDTAYVLRLFADRRLIARRRYQQYINQGVNQGRRDELMGGGLIRSHGGWTQVKALRLSDQQLKSDERILGDSDFVEQTLKRADEHYDKKYQIIRKGFDIDKVAARVSQIFGIDTGEICTPGKQRVRVQARSVLCYWAVHYLGYSMTALAEHLNSSQPAISLNVQRGAGIAKDQGLSLTDED